MFIALLILGGLLMSIGGILFIVDAFRVHWGWGLASILFPPANLVCLIMHWTATKRGFLLSLLALPFVAGGVYLIPKPSVTKNSIQPEKINDPFFNAVQKARAAMVKVDESRKEGGPVVAKTAVAPSSTSVPAKAPAVSAPKPVPVLTLAERLANNRAVFKALEGEFAELNKKRQSLPKNDSKAIAAFNIDAKAYADKLSAARSDQSILLELERTAPKK